MTLDDQIEQAAREGAGSYVIAYALLRVAKAIEAASENLALAVDGVAEDLREPEVSADVNQVLADVRARHAGSHS